MASTQLDLWPQDIGSEDVLTPEEILKAQADAIQARTNGLIRGEILRHETDDRIVLGMEIVSLRVDSRVRLFEAQHRREFEYPVAIKSHQSGLPQFLKREYFVPGRSTLASVVSTLGAIDVAFKGASGEWQTNEWVANSPIEFTDLVGKILGTSEVMSAVISLIARSQRSGSSPEQPSDTEPE